MARPWSEIAEKAASERVKRNHPETTAEAHARGVREGIERVRAIDSLDPMDGPMWASIACDRAKAAFNKEQNNE